MHIKNELDEKYQTPPTEPLGNEPRPTTRRESRSSRGQTSHHAPRGATSPGEACIPEAGSLDGERSWVEGGGEEGGVLGQRRGGVTMVGPQDMFPLPHTHTLFLPPQHHLPNPFTGVHEERTRYLERHLRPYPPNVQFTFIVWTCVLTTF